MTGLAANDRHEVERRAEACRITPQQWLTNVGLEERIPELFPETCPGCGQGRSVTDDAEFGRLAICINTACPYDK